MRFPTTSETLIAQLKSGEQAWADFFNRYSNVIFDLGKFKGLTDAEADDLVQEVMLRFNRRIEGGFQYDNDIARFRTFFGRIVQGCIYDQLRKRYRQEHIVPLTEDYPDDNRPDELLELALLEKWRHILKAESIKLLQAKVDIKTFQIFDLHVLQDQPAADVAKLLNTSTSNVYTIKSRGIETMRKIVDELNKADEGLDLRV